LLANWESLSKQAWVREYLGVEEMERDRRSLERRIHAARLGAFKSMADFDWSWPEKIDRDQVEDLLQLSFVDDDQRRAARSERDWQDDDRPEPRA
jgi:hypothetical protein